MTQLQDVSKQTIIFFSKEVHISFWLVQYIMEMCSEDGKKVMKGDTLGRVISGVSTFKEPLRSQRKNCVRAFLVVQVVQSTDIYLSG